MAATAALWLSLDAPEPDVPEHLETACRLLHANGIFQYVRGSSAMLLELHAALANCAHQADVPPPRRHTALALHSLLRWCFPPASSAQLDAGGALRLPAALPLEAAQLYSQLERHARDSPARPSVPMPHLPALQPTLRQYQREAVEWMIGREKGKAASASTAPPAAAPSSMLWRKLTLRTAASREAQGSAGSAVVIYWNMHSGALLPPGQTPPADGDVRGGILADEMGLGKSVEVLALVLAHPRPPPEAPSLAAAASGQGEPAERGGEEEHGCFCGHTPRFETSSMVQCDLCRRWVHVGCAGFGSDAEAEAAEHYTCLTCVSDAGVRSPAACGATLLVCPAAILSQWREEVQKHVGSHSSRDSAGGGGRDGRLRVCTYIGLRAALAAAPRDPSFLAACHPSALAHCDLVLTTFEALRQEFHHTDAGGPAADAQSRPHRRKVSYGASEARPLRSPLLSLVWWRLIIDEAQMVESSTAKAAAMARLLRAESRWAVSGTPLGRGKLSDLHGLLSFLGVEPWAEKAWWAHTIEAPLVREKAAEEEACLASMLACLPGVRRADVSLATGGTGLSAAQMCDASLRQRARHWLGVSAPAVKAACKAAGLCVTGSKGTLALRMAVRGLPKQYTEPEAGAAAAEDAGPVAWLAAGEQAGGPTALVTAEDDDEESAIVAAEDDDAQSTIEEEEGDSIDHSSIQHGSSGRAGTLSVLGPSSVAEAAADEACDTTDDELPPEPSSHDGRSRSPVAASAHALLLQLCHRYMWRNSKRTVRAQIGLPPQTQLVHSLRFSSIEEHFYRKQQAAVEARARAALAQRDSGGAADSALERLAAPLLRLRQACCHPQLGTHGIMAFRSEGGRRGKRKRKRVGPAAAVAVPMTMQAVVERLVDMETTACEDALREALFYAFALAGMAFSDGQLLPAARCYAEVYELCRSTRRPTPLPRSVTATIVGPAAEAGGEARAEPGTHLHVGQPTSAASEPIGPLLWRWPMDSATAAAMVRPVAEKTGAGVPAYPPGDLNVWMRVDLSKPKRLSRLIIYLGQLDTARGGERPAGPGVPCAEPGSAARVLWPRHCVLQANCKDGGPSVFVDVAQLELRPDASEPQHFDFYRPTKSRHWKLAVTSFWWAPGARAPQPAPPASAAEQLVCTVQRVELREAEVEVDPTHVLHLTHNLAHALRGCAAEARAPAASGLMGELQSWRAAAASPPTNGAPATRAVGDGVRLDTLSADAVSEQGKGLRAQMVGERTAVHRHAREVLSLSRRATDEVASKLPSPHWLRLVMPAVQRAGLDEALRERLRTDETIPDGARSTCLRLQSLLPWVEAEMAGLSAARAALLHGLDRLPDTPSEAEVRKNGDCASCRSDWGKTGERCAHCELEDVYNSVEAKLFSYRRARVVEIAPAIGVGDAGAAAANRGEAFKVDAPLVSILKAIARWIGAQVSTAEERVAGRADRIRSGEPSTRRGGAGPAERGGVCGEGAPEGALAARGRGTRGGPPPHSRRRRGRGTPW